MSDLCIGLSVYEKRFDIIYVATATYVLKTYCVWSMV